jgi:hypothetical protein
MSCLDSRRPAIRDRITSMRRSTAGCLRRAGLRLHGVLRRFPFLHRGSVMPNYAAHRRTGHRMMSRHVADNPAYRCALNTTMGVGDDGKYGDCNRQQQPLHVQFPLVTDHAQKWCPRLSPETLLPCTTRTRRHDKSCRFSIKGLFVPLTPRNPAPLRTGRHLLRDLGRRRPRLGVRNLRRSRRCGAGIGRM